MRCKKVEKVIQRISLFLICLSVVFVLISIEPVFRDKTNYANVNPGMLQTANTMPNPSIIILIFGGISGIIVRFVRKSFDEIKRGMDIVLAMIGLSISMPVLFFAYILIKLDSKGPAIYKQNRVGFNGKIFQILKLRSMVVDAEKGVGAVWAKQNDPRITPIGMILRKTRIDEIPQLINVLEGDMSIIGPRPERPEIVRNLKTVISDYDKRLIVKPGITGLAQIFHKYDETINDVRKKVKYDLLYIRKRCLLTDLGILAQTFSVVLTGKGAN